MAEIEPPDLHYFSATSGWLELGNVAEAEVEFAKISRELREHPDVLELEWAINVARRNWSAGLETAQKLLHVDPNRASGWLHLAYAWRRVNGGGLLAAWEALLPAATKFPDEPTVPFNLACYACQMGKLEEARVWLRRAMRSGGTEHVKNMALADPDLKPMWAEIKDM